MPALVIPQGTLVRLIWHLSGTPYAVNVLGTRKTGALVIDQALANTVGGIIKGAATTATLPNSWPPAVSLATVGVRDISAPNLPEFLDTGAAVVGLSPDNLLPPQVAYCVTLRTGRAGKSYRGRCYLPGFSESANTADGTVLAAAQTAAVTFLQEIMTDLPASGLSLAILSRKNLSTELVTSAQGRDLVWDTIRGRATAGIQPEQLVPITILDPPGSGIVGPGIGIRVSTDLIGPLPVTAFWEIVMHPPSPSETIISQGKVTTQQTTNVLLIPGWIDGIWQTLLPQTPAATHGTPARAVVRLWQDPSTLLEQTSFTTSYDAVTAMPDVAIRAQASAGMGFTGSDRAILLNVQAWLIWELVGELLPEIANLIAGHLRTPPVKRAYGSGSGGEGEIPPPQIGPFVKWVGLAWDLVQYPQGWGVDAGNPELIEIDYMQLHRMRASDTGIDLIDEGGYERAISRSWYWGMQDPAAVRFYILPGGVVQFYYLLQLEPISA